MTNEERIKTMTIAQLANFLTRIQKEILESIGARLGEPQHFSNSALSDARKEWREWLKQEID